MIISSTQDLTEEAFETMVRINGLLERANKLQEEIPDYEERMKTARYQETLRKADYLTRYLILLTE